MVYQQQQGLLYVLGFVATRDDPVELSITIPEGVATSADGASNAAAQATLAYQPTGGTLGWLGDASSIAFGGTMVLSFATGMMGGECNLGRAACGCLTDCLWDRVQGVLHMLWLYSPAS